MKDLIEALNIFLKYGDYSNPTHCEHDVLWVVGYNPEDFTEDDMKRLKELGFFYAEDDECFQSYRYGSC